MKGRRRRDEISLAALSAIRELLEPYDYYIDSAVGNSRRIPWPVRWGLSWLWRR